MSQETIINLEQIQKNHEIEELPESPINIDVTKSTKKILPPLIWNNFDKIPIKVKITNSGQTRKKQKQILYKNQVKKISSSNNQWKMEYKSTLSNCRFPQRKIRIFSNTFSLG